MLLFLFLSLGSSGSSCHKNERAQSKHTCTFAYNFRASADTALRISTVEDHVTASPPGIYGLPFFFSKNTLQHFYIFASVLKSSCKYRVLVDSQSWESGLWARKSFFQSNFVSPSVYHQAILRFQINPVKGNISLTDWTPISLCPGALSSHQDCYMVILRLLWYPKRNGECGFHSDVLLARTWLSGHGLLSSHTSLIAPQALGQEWEQRPGFLSPSSECSILFSTFLHERIKHVWISSLETPVYWPRVMGLPLLILGCLANSTTAAVTDNVHLLKAYLSAHWKCPPLASLAAHIFPLPVCLELWI